MIFCKGQVSHTVFIMCRAPEGFSHPSYNSKQSSIHKADLPACSFILFKSPEVLRPKGQIISGADLSFTRKVTMIRYTVYQAEWASAPHSLLRLNVTFKDSPTSSVGPLCLFCYKAQRDIIVKVVDALSVNCKHFCPGPSFLCNSCMIGWEIWCIQDECKSFGQWCTWLVLCLTW